MLDVNKSLLFQYIKKSSIPYPRFLRLCKLANLKSEGFEISLIEINNGGREVKLPAQLGEKLSELLGVLAGDGHVSTIKYQVRMCGHKQLDREYISKHVFSLFKEVFGVTPFVSENNSSLVCGINSKAVVFFLSSKFGVPLGKKKNRLRIPKDILTNRILLINYMRGLFDTDGSIYRHHKNDLALDITSVSPKFRKDIVIALRKLGFSPTANGKNIQLYRQNEIHRFFDQIRPANQKHLIKYDAFNTLGYLPKANDLFAAVV